jgi:hypothetical protein
MSSNKENLNNYMPESSVGKYSTRSNLKSNLIDDQFLKQKTKELKKNSKSSINIKPNKHTSF